MPKIEKETVIDSPSKKVWMTIEKYLENPQYPVEDERARIRLRVPLQLSIFQGLENRSPQSLDSLSTDGQSDD